MKRRLMALVAVIALVIAACGGEEGGDTTEGGADTTEAGATTTAAAADTTAAGGASTTAAAAGGDCLVGMSWNNYNEERWAKHDEPAIQAALEAGGCEYTSTDAGSSAEQQITDVETLIGQGADVVIILAQDTAAILPAVQSATDQGIPVIAYDRLIEDANTFYVSFDNVLVGQLMAEVVFGLVPEGNYFIVKGNGSDANSDFLREGIGSVIDAAAVEGGPISILEEDYTDNWEPDLAQDHVETWLTAHDNDVQAIISENDGMATGAAAALADQGLLGTVVLSGQDADVAALQRVATGDQAVSVWKDARLLGTNAGEAAVALAGGATMADVEGTGEFVYTNKTSGAETVLTSILLTPVPITQDNLNEVTDAEWISVEDLCSTGGTVGPCA